MKTNEYMFYIICPTYNSSNYISDAINAVKRQNYHNWKLIIVDDGSTDNTVDVVNFNIKNDNRFVLLKKTNEGPLLAREYGIDYVKQLDLDLDSFYFLFLDSDDFFRKNALDYLNSQLNFESNLDFVYFNSTWINQNGLVKKPNYYIKNTVLLSDTRSIIMESVINNTYSYIWSACIKPSLLFEHNIIPKTKKNIKICEDFIVLFNIYCNSSKALYIQDSLYVHRDTQNSIVHGYCCNDWIMWLCIMDEINKKAFQLIGFLKNLFSDNKIDAYCFQVEKTIKLMAIEKYDKKTSLNHYKDFKELFLVRLAIERGIITKKSKYLFLLANNKHLKLFKKTKQKAFWDRFKPAFANIGHWAKITIHKLFKKNT